MLGIYMMNAPWKNWPQEAQHRIEKLINQHFSGQCGPRNGQEIGQILHSLRKLGARWNDFSDETKKSLMNGFRRNLSHMHPHDFAMSVSGLVGMSMTLEIFTQEDMHRIDKKFDQYGNEFGEKELIAFNASFLQMGTSWQQLPSNYRKLMLSLSSKEKYRRISALALSNAIYTLGVFGFRWLQLPTELRAYFMEHLPKASGMDGSHLANIVHAFGLLGVEWSSLPENVRKFLCDMPHAENIRIRFRPLHIARILSGLSKMQATWTELAAKALQMVFRKNQPDMHKEIFRMSLHGLAMLDAQWTSLDPSTKLVIRDGILAHSKAEDGFSEVSNLIHVAA